MAVETKAATWNRRTKSPVSDDMAATRVDWLARQAQRYFDYWQVDINRYVENGRMVWGVDFGQWPWYVVDQLINKEGRRPPQYNIMFDKIETFIGSCMSNGWDIRYEPENPELPDAGKWALMLQDMYSTDESRFTWQQGKIYTLLDMAIAVGYRRMYINHKKVDWRGNPDWETLNPRHTFLDPSWKDNDPDNLRNYFTYWDQTATEIMYNSPENVSDKLKNLRDRELMDGVDHGLFETFSSYDSAISKWMSLHRVWEFHWVDEKTEFREYDRRNSTPFPDTGHPKNSTEDRAAKIKYIADNKLDPENDIGWQEQTIRTKYIQRVCPTIDKELMLVDGKDEVQTNNVNLYPIGIRYEGQFMGLADRDKDCQISLNKLEMDADEIMARKAKTGFLLDEDLADGDETKKREIEESWNLPGAKAWVKGGTTADLGSHGGIIPFPESHVNSDEFALINHRLDMNDRLMKVPAAMDARQQHQRTPAIMFQNQIEVGLLGQKFYSELLRVQEIREAQAYARQVRHTYSGEPRRFGGMKDIASFVVNQFGFDTQGQRTTVNDITKMPEMLAVAVQAKDAMTMRMQLRTMYGEVTQMMAKVPGAILPLLCATKAIVNTITMPDTEKEEMTKAFDMTIMNEALKVSASIKQARAMIEGAQQQANGKMGLPPQNGQGGAAGQGEMPDFSGAQGADGASNVISPQAKATQPVDLGMQPGGPGSDQPS